MKGYGAVLGVGLIACLLGPAVLLADFYDEFDDGDYTGDPNFWDIDNPNWIIYNALGTPNAIGVIDGWFHLWGATVWGQLGIFCYPDTGDHDPNTGETWWDHTQTHYVLAKTKNMDPQPDPNDNGGESVLLLHASPYTWIGFAFEYPYARYGGGSAKPRISSVGGPDPFSVIQWGNIDISDPCFPDEPNGFWMLFAYFSDGNPDPEDPNGKYLRAALWNGDKFNWNGEWLFEADLGDPNSWKDPNLADHPDWWSPAGPTTLGTIEFRLGIIESYVAYDHVEARTGIFDPNNPAHLDLTIANAHMGAIEINPDLPDPNDPNTADARLCRYTNGTDIVLIAEPLSGKSLKHWIIYDPNHPGDANYIAEDTNSVLYLTMDADWEIEAKFKCGGGVPPFIAMTLLALAVGVALRRAT